MHVSAFLSNVNKTNSSALLIQDEGLPLAFAAMEGDAHAVELLIKWKARVNDTGCVSLLLMSYGCRPISAEIDDQI
jgi:hypothetical protein